MCDSNVNNFWCNDVGITHPITNNLNFIFGVNEKNFVYDKESIL